MPLFTATQLGAIPLRGIDNYRPLQAVIDLWKRYGGTLDFPNGVYESSQTAADWPVADDDAKDAKDKKEMPVIDVTQLPFHTGHCRTI